MMLYALGVFLIALAFEIGWQWGRRTTLDGVVSALRKLPVAREVRIAITKALRPEKLDS